MEVNHPSKAYPARVGSVGNVPTPDPWATDWLAGVCPVPPLPFHVTTYVILLAEQLAEVPEFTPAHVQFHGPVPVTADAVPTEQRFAEGTEASAAPFEDPQTPSSFFGDEHVAAVPPYCPEHVQSNAPSVPATSASVFVPEAHQFAVGYEYDAAVAVQHDPQTEAWQSAPSQPYPEEHWYRHAAALAEVEYEVAESAGAHAEPFQVWRYDETVFQEVPVAGFAAQEKVFVSAWQETPFQV